MKRLLLAVATLLGFVSSASVMSYTKSDSIIEGNSFFSLGYGFTGDFEYNTENYAGP